MIVKSGNKYLVKTEAGDKILGTHSSHDNALRQLRAIEVSKAKRAARNHIPKMGR